MKKKQNTGVRRRQQTLKNGPATTVICAAERIHLASEGNSWLCNDLLLCSSKGLLQFSALPDIATMMLRVPRRLHSLHDVNVYGSRNGCGTNQSTFRAA